ncbi:hypothetical protein [[Phormidium] sp. ETS-05]|uniref:hypothetical protein n=1 Tax=[Phormidium] sp. ETS-05 TaxID=222819 RepID=UPI0018EEE121|nr:hypothetical protein [[Phormidium] sp. ETS-05]
MRTRSEKVTTSSPTIFSAQTLIVSGITWAVLALLFFLLFSTIPAGDEGRPLWYSIGTFVFGLVANVGAGILCLRNWRSPQVVSGRTVWLAIGIGMLSYAIGDILFGCWELVWGLDPDVTLGDMFYLLTYICLGWGMVLAVVSKRLNLEKWQWAVLIGIAAAGIALAVWVSMSPVGSEIATTEALAAEVSQPATTAPAFIETIDNTLSNYAYYVGLFYVVADVFLLIIATALLLAFWGGRFSQSWQMIAAGTFSLYIADMWFKYAERLTDYQSGSLLEVFWVFSPVLFGIGAVLEYHISTRSRQGRRRRGGAVAAAADS